MVVMPMGASSAFLVAAGWYLRSCGFGSSFQRRRFGDLNDLMDIAAVFALKRFMFKQPHRVMTGH